MRAHPFIIIPWENDFLAGLARLVLTETNGNPARACIIVPHSRPRRYFADTLHAMPELPKPFALSQMLTVSELFGTLRSEIENNPPDQIEMLDRVGLLLRCLEQETQDSHDALPLPTGDTNRFFPWGVRLANLLEDFYNQNIEPEDVTYMEGQVVDFAAGLLGSLGRIHRAYTAELDARGWTTPGYDAFRVLRYIEAQRREGAAPEFACLRGKHIFVAGFYGLTGVEEAIFRHLSEEHGAHIVLHSDVRLADAPSRAHWACREHTRWLSRWNSKAVCIEEPESRKRETVFHEGFDLHSQLDVLERTLSEYAPESKTDASSDNAPATIDSAVVLPDTGLLMPVLHHLPRKDVNISMGYPLGRSTLFRLLETVMRLQETANAKSYHWKEVIGLLRHPYLKMLTIAEERPLGVPLHHMEASVRTGRRYTDPRALHPDLDEQGRLPEADVRTLLAAVLDLTVTRWEDLATPQDMADTLADLCTLLLTHGGDLWDRFPIDAESIFRLMHRVIPMLRECSLATQAFPRDVLFTILRETIRQERVPFEADPLTGVQVMGMLETRLLRFNTVHVIDATEDKLPGAPANDPLLPDSLRGMLGLPDSRHRELVSAYNFHRLLQGAENITIYYQSGVERSGLFEEKRARSRFVEELLWQEEKKRGTLITAGTPPLHAISYPMPAITRMDKSVERTPEVSARLNEYLQRPLSPSALDTYLTCPVRFFHERLCGVGSVDEVNEGDDYAGIGDLLHSVLEDFYTPYLKRMVRFEEDDALRLQDLFSHKLHQSELKDSLPFDSFLMLEAAGRKRLASFIDHQPETWVVALEQRYEAEVAVDGKTRRLAGRMDRVDEREGQTVILDYKTGKVSRPNPDIWGDDMLWSRLRCWQGEDDDTLALLAGKLPSVQLPAYLYIYPRGVRQGAPLPVGDAGWVELRSNGKEVLLFGPGTEEDVREAVIGQQIPLLMEFLFRHMETVPFYRPNRGKHCAWCTCANCCSV
ncbi:PD-(D/E)XK nuclease family protein [Desulfovibrio mangrovi]|uniref:PD-(D/E)XK nuclease family protein n=1 Tax=Desulfovibrio mangrovi TaxID=2976983 RepID=UPI0022468E4A|nr:PD-(D/E)XK nuclease family protein [Desulfovibrio mangrovi]UZP68042.1 PD-(D/E)XK nuclease family protein [Desulfovibrio mangrovi]